MGEAISTTRSLLQELLEGVPAFEPAGSDRVCVAEVLVTLARDWPQADGVAHRAPLEALCRKVHVAKKVWASYGASWERLASEPELDPALWPLLVGVLAAYGTRAEGATEDERGLALKYLSAGLAAVDLASASGGVEIPSEQREHIRRIVAIYSEETTR